MVLRNVPSTATFEEQRVEINELAVDVEALAAAVGVDTLQSVTDRGFTTTNPIKIENNAATAFVIEDGSSNEKFVVDSVNGKLNVGSSAGGASGIYLFHNNAGATPAITLDGATGSITNKGQLVTESILSSAALNNKGSVQFGTVDAYSIGHMPLNSNLAFSQTHGGSYLFYSDASTVELEIADGGVKVDGILESSLLVNTNKTPTAGEGIEMFYDSAASGGAAGSIQAYDRDGAALTRLKIRSSNWDIENDGTATFGGAVIHGQLTAGGTGGNYLSNGEVAAYGPSTSANLWRGWNASGGSNVLTSSISALGSAMFANDITLDRPTAPSDVKISGSDTHAVWLSDGKFALKYDGSATFAGQLGVNQTSINSNRQMEITQPSGFTSALRINSAGTSGDGAYFEVFVGSANYKFGGDHLTNALLFKKDGTEYMRHTSSGGIQLNNPNGDTSLSIGDPTNAEGRLILTSKTNTVEIHSRGNHPIEFLFNTATKTKMTIDGGLNFEESGAGIVFDWQTQASGATSDKLDHYEEGTWTPTIDRLDTSPTTATYTYNTGRYTRIGNVVTVYFDMTISALGGGAGRFVIAGLPFDSATDSNSGGYGSPQFRNSTAFSVEAQERPSSYHSLDTINLRYTTSSNGEDDMTVGPGRITGWSVYFAS
jgi:hypothetical protein